MRDEAYDIALFFRHCWLHEATLRHAMPFAVARETEGTSYALFIACLRALLLRQQG